VNDRRGKTLRTAAIIFMGLTAAMNVLGGAGTVCAAFLTKQFPPMWAFLDYQLLYQTLMIVTIAIGIVNIRSTIKLVRGGKNVHRDALIILFVGSIVSGIQMFASLSIRGKATPANVKFFTNLATLLIFLLLKLPGLRDQVDFSQRGGTDRATAGGLAAIVAGIVMFTTEFWVGSSHVFQGTNWVHVLQVPLLIGGTVLTLGGLGLLVWVAADAWSAARQQREAPIY